MDESQALVPYVPPESRERALLWAGQAEDERRRQAMAAAAAHDDAALCTILTAYMLTKSRQHQAVSVHTLSNYCRAARFLSTYWSDENLLHPTRDAGDRFVSLLSRSLSPGSVRLYLAGAKALYKALRWVRATTADPFNEVYAPRDRTAPGDKRQAYSQTELALLLACGTPAERLFILLCSHGGLRLQEALALEWADMHGGFVAFRVQHGKGDSVRTVKCSHSLRVQLADQCPWPAVGPVVQSSWARGYKDPTMIRRIVARLCGRAGVPYRGIHAFRHTAATRLMAETGNLQLVATHMGHKSIQTTTIYAKMSSTVLAEQLDTW